MIGAIVSFVCIDLICLSYSMFVYDYSSQHVCRFTIKLGLIRRWQVNGCCGFLQTFSLFHSSTALHTRYSELDDFSVLDFQCWYLTASLGTCVLWGFLLYSEIFHAQCLLLPVGILLSFCVMLLSRKSGTCFYLLLVAVAVKILGKYLMSVTFTQRHNSLDAYQW